MTCMTSVGRDRESVSPLILFEFSEAFDTTDHGILLEKLTEFRVGSSTCDGSSPTWMIIFRGWCWGNIVWSRAAFSAEFTKVQGSLLHETTEWDYPEFCRMIAISV